MPTARLLVASSSRKLLRSGSFRSKFLFSQYLSIEKHQLSTAFSTTLWIAGRSPRGCPPTDTSRSFCAELPSFDLDVVHSREPRMCRVCLPRWNARMPVTACSRDVDCGRPGSTWSPRSTNCRSPILECGIFSGRSARGEAVPRWSRALRRWNAGLDFRVMDLKTRNSSLRRSLGETRTASCCRSYQRCWTADRGLLIGCIRGRSSPILPSKSTLAGG